MPTVAIPDRALVTVSGPDAEHFLHNLVTTDIEGLEPGTVRPGALLTPQGKILFDFLVSRARDDAFRLETRTDAATDFAKRLVLYKLRAKVDISVLDQAVVTTSWASDSSSSQNDSISPGLRDTRFGPENAVFRHYGGEARDADAALHDWIAFRIEQGMPEEGSDYAAGEAFPHDALLDQTGGVSFKKGCYVGQEVVSRMQHRGTARRRVLMVRAERPLPSPGTDLTAGGKTLGTLGSVAGNAGLAMVRIDRVKAAMDAGTPVLAGDVAVEFGIPDWAGFAFPETASETDGA
ncbi:MAG: folate-binding protein YgfZ [Notoacmeibacter sp.]|nr:folate-binding protein YgfZ [Notoacmeibacter sp.]